MLAGAAASSISASGSWTGSSRPISRCIRRAPLTPSGATKETTTPERPARAVRPERWMYALWSSGGSKWKTAATSSTWMPRAATSVATRAWTRPPVKSARARVRCAWLRPPWIAAVRMPALPSCRASRSEPWRVRQKTMAGQAVPMASASTPLREVRSTFQNRCLAAVMSGVSSPTSWRTGSRWWSRVRWATSPSRVAENSTVWRSVAVCSRSRRTTGRKPMSAMRSASSMTTRSTAPRSTRPWPIRSSRRPGQATRTSTPLRRAVTWGP